MLRLENCSLSEDEKYENELKEPRARSATLGYMRRAEVRSMIEEYDRLQRLSLRRKLKRQMRRQRVGA